MAANLVGVLVFRVLRCPELLPLHTVQAARSSALQVVADQSVAWKVGSINAPIAKTNFKVFGRKVCRVDSWIKRQDFIVPKGVAQRSEGMKE
jgi:hypothetical protein